MNKTEIKAYLVCIDLLRNQYIQDPEKKRLHFAQILKTAQYVVETHEAEEDLTDILVRS